MNDTLTPSRPAFAINGELTIYSATEWRDRLLGEMAGNDDIELDLDAVSEIDSSGLQLLLAVRRQATGEGRRLRIAASSQAVRSTLEFCGLSDLLDHSDAAPTQENPA